MITKVIKNSSVSKKRKKIKMDMKLEKRNNEEKTLAGENKEEWLVSYRKY